VLKKVAYVLLAFALLLAAGGCFAFAKVGSLISLLSLFFLCALAMLKNRASGAFSALVGLGLLALILLVRLAQTHSFMPAGFLLILTLGVFFVTGYTVRKVRA